MFTRLFIVTALALVSNVVATDQEIPEIVHFTDEVLKDGAEEFKITDNDGKLVGVVDVFFQEGYQLDKPVSEEENVCLVRQIQQEKDGEEICYTRKKLSQDQLDSVYFAKIQQHCEGRELFINEPHDCRSLGFEDKETAREKRFLFCCGFKWHWSVKCTKYNTIWFVKVCVKWDNKWVWEWKCSC